MDSGIFYSFEINVLVKWIFNEYGNLMYSNWNKLMNSLAFHRKNDESRLV